MVAILPPTLVSGIIEPLQNENKGLLTYKEELGDKKGNLVATLQYAPQIGVFPEEEYIMEI
ncbi:MAG: hypothetical protein AWU57_4318 [Marinobacter sp. T13-3]|nr:MAG: hypothetical protein AWU57_4318 [Marinobacter sp. T13-3]